MDYRPLDITVISATGLKNVNLFMKMGVYVVVSLINGDTVTKKKTHVSYGGSNPKWNHRIKFSVEEAAIHSSTLVFVLRCSRILGDRYIGELTIPIRDLIESASGSEEVEHVVDYQICSMKGKARGILTFSHQFKKLSQNQESGKPIGNNNNNNNNNNNKASGEDSVKSYTSGRTSYSANPTGMMYVMPQQGMSHYPQASYPPPQGYGTYTGPGQYGGMWYPHSTPGPYQYQPQQMGFVYNQQQMPPQPQPQPPQQPPQQQQQQPQSPVKKIGGGGGGKLALGLGAGLVGGLLVGDMVSDVAEAATEDAMDSNL